MAVKAVLQKCKIEESGREPRNCRLQVSRGEVPRDGVEPPTPAFSGRDGISGRVDELQRDARLVGLSRF